MPGSNYNLCLALEQQSRSAWAQDVVHCLQIKSQWLIRLRLLNMRSRGLWQMLVFWCGRLPGVEPDSLWDGIGYPHLQKQKVFQYIFSTKPGRDLYGLTHGAAA